MKHSEKSITVTLLQRNLALLPFVVLPILGFYFGMRYQSMIIYSPTADTSVSAGSWKTYSDPSGNFSLQIPTNWTVNAMHLGDQPDKDDIRLVGKEGKIDIRWVRNYGGACPPKGYEKIQLKDGTVDVCHEVNSGIEHFSQMEKRFNIPNDPGLGVTVDAQTLDPNIEDKKIILQILSTLLFKD